MAAKMVQNLPLKPNVTHVIFDMDGLLLATEDLYTQAANQVAAKYAKSQPPKTVTWQLKVRQMGLQKKELAQIMVQELDLNCTPDEYLSATEEIHHSLFPDSELLKGVDRLIRHFHAKNVPIAVATSSSRPYFELKTQKHKDLFGLFHHIVTGHSDPEVKRGKPFPDINLVCASRFENPKPESVENCLVFEDSPNGVKAALAAGMQCVMVPDPMMWTTPEYMKEAHLVIESMTDFKPELFGLPGFLQ